MQLLGTVTYMYMVTAMHMHAMVPTVQCDMSQCDWLHISIGLCRLPDGIQCSVQPSKAIAKAAAQILLHPLLFVYKGPSR